MGRGTLVQNLRALWDGKEVDGLRSGGRDYFQKRKTIHVFHQRWLEDRSNGEEPASIPLWNLMRI